MAKKTVEVKIEKFGLKIKPYDKVLIKANKTKGNMENLELELRGVEKSKTACARKHFAAISSDTVKYKIIETYDDLLKVIGE
jgi:restriction endonuclease